MFSRIFTTSWQHISRTRLASIGIVTILTGLFLTFFIGFFLIEQAEVQRQVLVKKFNYPIFISNQYAQNSQEVNDFFLILKKTVALPEDIQYISKDVVLDMQIQKDPSILKILGNINPLNDIVMVPLYGTDIAKLLSLVESHKYLFETIQSMDDVQKSLVDFQGTLSELQRLTRVTQIFLVFMGILMSILLIVVMRIHIHIFHDEKHVCELVGASPWFYWSPHFVSMIVYIGISGGFGFLIFSLFRIFFSS